MKFALSNREVKSLYRSLSKEVFEYFSYTPEFKIPFKIVPVLEMGAVANSAIAATSFGYRVDGGGPLDWRMEWRMEPKPLAVHFNGAYLPYLYEDEVICVLLHELCHVVAGHNASHGPKWSRMAYEVGSVGKAAAIPRKFEQMIKDGVFGPFVPMGPRTPTLCNSVED